MGAVWGVWGRLFWLEWGLVGVGSYRQALLDGGMEESAFASDEFMQGTGFVQNCLVTSSAKHVLS